MNTSSASHRLATVAGLLIGLAGLESRALSQVPRLIWQYSTDAGMSWKNSGYAGVNNLIKIRAMVDWTGIAAFGLSGVRHQVFIDNVANDPGPTIARNGEWNRVLPFNFGAATLAVRTDGTTTRIVALGIHGDEGYISSAQQAPASAGFSYSIENPARIFQFDYNTGTVGARTLVIRSVIATTGGVPEAFAFHSSATSTASNFYASGIYEGASIVIVPAPATAGVALACAGLRRRRPVIHR